MLAHVLILYVSVVLYVIPFIWLMLLLVSNMICKRPQHVQQAVLVWQVVDYVLQNCHSKGNIGGHVKLTFFLLKHTSGVYLYVSMLYLFFKRSVYSCA